MKKIVGFESYCITKDGRVWSFKSNKFLKPYKHPNGYFQVTLTNENRKEKKLIHRLVAESYIENHQNKEYVNHLNGIKKDNRIENLEWSTPSENIKHAYDTNLRRSYVRKIDTKQIPTIMKMRNEGLSYKKISEHFSVSPMTIHNLIKRKTYRDVVCVQEQN